MKRRKILDLFSCAGGAARGYQRAGWEVWGVDIVPRPNYTGDGFVQWDAVDFVTRFGADIRREYDAIHWSPPCQEANTLHKGTNRSRGWGKDHVQFIPLMRPHIDAIGLPNVLEQPVGDAPMRRDLMLCMGMFPIGDPPWVQRHRWFELNGFVLEQPKHVKHEGYVRGYRHGVYRDGPYVAAYGSGGGKATVPEMQHALQIDWTDVREELTEAIPPAYTEYIGRGLLAAVAP